MITFIKSCSDDKSWRMRYVLADKIVEVAKCLDREAIMQHLVDSFVSFLQDVESEVRAIATTRSAEFCKIMDGPTVVKKVIPALKKLSTDTFMHVRSMIHKTQTGRGFVRESLVHSSTHWQFQHN